MKRIFCQLNLPILFFLSLFIQLANAQPWSAPVNVDNGVGTTGNTGQFPSLLTVKGNPAIAYYDPTHQSLTYIRAINSDGTVWGIPKFIDADVNVGTYTSMALIEGKPAISYYDATNFDLKFIIALDSTGTTWSSPITLESIGNIGQYTTLKEVNGNPAISFYDVTNGDLKYIRATNPSGSSWGTSTSIDASGIVGLYASLQIINGNPAISYYDQTNGDLKYIYAADASGTSWNAPISIDALGTVGQHTSLQVIGGKPAISYYDVTNFDLKFIAALDISGSTWSIPSTLDAPGTIGTFTSLMEVNGYPTISYFDATNGDLKYITALDNPGTSWGPGFSIDVTGIVGQYTSLQIINGNPAIAYYDVTNGNLKYIRAGDPSGTSWATALSIDITGITGQHTSIATLNNRPLISYFDASNADLKFVRALDATGINWSTPISVDVTGTVGTFNSLQIVNGFPAISYTDGTNFDLKYVRALNALGTSWGTPISIDITGSVGLYTSLQIINGNPAISYFDATNGDLKFVSATDISGTTWGTPISIDITGTVGQFTSLKVINGNPAISYLDVTNFDLKYVRATDASGSSWDTPVSIDLAGNVGQYTSLQVVNGNPAISYYDITNADLKYVSATDASGASWSAPITVDATGSTGQFNSLQVINGKPAISYYDASTRDLKYTVATDLNGTSWSTPILVDSDGQVGQYTSMITRDTGAAIAYYNSSKALPYFVTNICISETPTVAISASATTICAGGNVNFTATSTFGGPTPSYQWKVGATDVGTNTPTFSSIGIVTGEVVTVIMTSSYACPAPLNVTSNAITMTVTPTVTPSVTITSTATTICAGTLVTFTATPINGGASPTYRWKINGVLISTTLATTFGRSTLLNGDVVTVEMTSNATCPLPAIGISNAIAMTVNPTLPTNVTISATSTAICTGTNIDFTAIPTNSGTTPSYQWRVNGLNVGTNSTSFSSSTLLNGNNVSVVMTSNALCASPTIRFSTNVFISVSATPVIPTVTINPPSTTTICSGNFIGFSTSATNAGSTPIYKWKIGSTIVGTNSWLFSTTTLADGDVVTVELTSSAACAIPAVVTSNPITMTVSSTTLTPSVSVIASATSICPSTNILFTATPTNGGPAPSYQWKVGATNVGFNSPTFNTSTLVNGNVVSVTMTSSLSCALPTSGTSIGIPITVIPSVSPTVSVTPTATSICNGTNVLFTANPTNEGTTPTYQWKIGATNVGTNSPTYSSSTLGNGNSITVVMTSNAPCASPTIRTSTAIIMAVTNNTVPIVSITTPSTTVCTGVNVTFTSSSLNGGATPSYQWKIGSTNVGTNASTFSTTSLTNGDVVSVEMTSSNSCSSPTTATSAGIAMTVNTGTLLPSVTVSTASTSICAGTLTTFTATPTNGGTTPSYQWKIGSTNTGSNSPIFSSGILVNGNVVSVVMTSNSPCASPTTATSTGITMTVNAVVTPSVLTSTPSTSICNGSSTTFTATPNNGGTTPTYQWKIGVTNVGTNSPIFTTSALANGNVVSVVMTSNALCVSPTTATSSGITMTVNSSLIPTVTISTISTTICAGTNTTFTALPINGGTTPSYQWKIGATNVGINSPIYFSSILNNGDIVSVVVTSNSPCASPITATSAGIPMTVNPAFTPSVSLTTPTSSICLGNNATFTAVPTNGGTTPMYQWKVNAINAGVNSPTFSTSALAQGDVVSVEVTSNSLCVSPNTATSAGTTMTVSPYSTPTISLSRIPSGVICAGTNVSFNSSATNEGTTPSYQWYLNGNPVGTNNSTYSNASLLNGDNVYLDLTSNLTCLNSTTVSSAVNGVAVSNSTTSATAGVDKIICSTDLLTLTGTIGNGATTGTWSTNGSGTFSPSINSLVATYAPSSLDKTSGTVTLTLTASGGACFASTDDLLVTINQCTNTLNNEAKSTISISPNPNNGNFTISTSEIEGRFEIKTIEGKLLKTIYTAQGITAYEINGLKNGMYFITLTNKDTILFKNKIIVE